MVAKQKEYIPEMDERGFMRHLDDLKKGYRKTLKRLQDRREQIVEAGLESECADELDLIKGMVSDVNYAIEWLHTGRQPNAKRGIDRRSVYQRTVFMDPAIMERYMRPTNTRSASTLTEDDKHRLEEVLELLSPRERECYEMHYGDGLPHSKIAEILNIPRSNVGEYVKRAHEKVSRGWQGTLF